jgi:hypothetical protein
MRLKSVNLVLVVFTFSTAVLAMLLHVPWSNKSGESHVVALPRPMTSHAFPENPVAHEHIPVEMAHVPRREHGRYSGTLAVLTSASAHVMVPEEAVAPAVEHPKELNGGLPSWL